jgi:hypothetical protein
MSDEQGQGRAYLPWIMAVLVLVVGGSKLDQARPYIARALALAVPVVPVAIGVKRVEAGGPQLERLAAIVGWTTIVAAEACVAAGVFGFGALSGSVGIFRIALYGAAAAALAVHTLEARSVGKARFAGYIGLVAGFGVYLSSHGGADAYASVFGAFFVGLLLGGGSGLLLGELLGRLFQKG